MNDAIGTPGTIDPITVEVIGSALSSIVEEMGELLPAKLLAECDLSRAPSVLEIGCGTGEWLRAMARRTLFTSGFAALDIASGRAMRSFTMFKSE